jgi:DNA double-strand break repair helicase HerA and related ATPase
MADLDKDGTIFIGRSNKPEVLRLELANRHGLVSGATGTGKTVTLQVLAEGFSRAGVPVFVADVKGDLSGVSEVGEGKEAFIARAKSLGLDYEPDQFPVVFWDLFGVQGHPVRATISEVGPLLLSHLMDLNEIQESVLNTCFRVADEQGLPILDLKDLRAMVAYISDHAAELTLQYGNISKQTIGTIQHPLQVLEDQGGYTFFGEPALAIKDFIRTDRDGRGFINILAADKLMESPLLYATFHLWLLSALFEELPEVGFPMPKPKFCFFFDEAHLLFTDAPKALLGKIEQVVRLIRSKGVGVYFVTQNPLDVPDEVLAQLGNRVQHALRAFTPRDQQAVKAAADMVRPNPKLDTAKVITELGKGEALVSFLEGDGTPPIVERCVIRPPSARVGPITPDERMALMAKSPVKGKYEQAIDSESAFEILRLQAGAPGGRMGMPGKATAAGGLGAVLTTIGNVLANIFGTSRPGGTQLARTEAIRDMVELKESGIQIKFTCGEAPSIALRKNEEVFCDAPTTLVEPRAVRTWRSTYGGPSLRIAKGLSFRFGASSGTSESHEEMRPIDVGTMVLTNQRMIFVGSKRTIGLPIEKIIGIDDEGYFNWLRLNLEGKQKAEIFEFDSALQIKYEYKGETRSAPFHVAWLIAAINQVLIFRQR